MKENMTKLGFFTIPEYEKEEQWLRRQHNEGWKFTGVSFLCFYHFVKCEAEDVIYQLDYNKDGRKNKTAYHQMYSDCGWEYITDFVGYTYFCKAMKDMKTGEEGIFNDADSKLDMVKRVFVGRMIPLLVIMLAVILPQLFVQYHMNNSLIFYMYIALLTFYIVMFSWFGWQYWKLRSKL